MRTKSKVGLTAAWAALGVLATFLVSLPPAHAFTYSSVTSAVLVFPLIRVVPGEVDTLIQIGNASNNLISAHCFYVNANSHCSTTGQVCTSASECFDSQFGFFGSCDPGWIEINFDIALTMEQPVVWRASEGCSMGSAMARLIRLFRLVMRAITS